MIMPLCRMRIARWACRLGFAGLFCLAVSGCQSPTPADTGPVHLVKQGYKGFNVIEHNGVYYALGQDEGAFAMSKVDEREYKHLFIGETEKQAEDFVDQSFLPARLVVEGYKKFNILAIGTRYYGLAQEEGAFDLAKLSRKEYHHAFVAESIEAVKNQIDNASAAGF